MPFVTTAILFHTDLFTNVRKIDSPQHICADTLRSIVVLIAAGFSTLFPELLSPAGADSFGAIIVSVIIIISLAPLLQGLLSTALQIRDLVRERPHDNQVPNFFAISRR